MTTEIDFPSSATCIIRDTYKETIPQKKRYLGNKSYRVDDTIIKCTILFTTDVDLTTFKNWWVNDIDYGYLPFNIDLPYFGSFKPLVVKLKTNLDSIMKYRYVREVPIILEVVSQNMQIDDTGSTLNITPNDVIVTTT